MKHGVDFGLGVRIGIASTKFKGSLASSIAGVAANATIGTATTNYAILAPGLGPGITRQ